jgi:hypothetical protein
MNNSIVLVEKIIDAETVNTTATVSSSAIKVGYASDFGVFVKLAGSSPDVTIRYQVIDSNVNDVNAVASGEDSESAWITPTTGSDILVNISASAADGFSPMVTKWMRIQVVGNAGNGADTVASIHLSSYIK